MENSPHQAHTSYSELVFVAQTEADYAHNYLDAAGIIDYSRFDDETLRLLAEGPGPVIEPATVRPYHVGTTTLEFAQQSNNFHLLFDKFWGESRREESFYQRFAILFPNFAEALTEQYQEYESRCGSSYVAEPELFESLRTAYGIMSQLIDQNDVYDQELLVRDIDATKVLRA